jgi:hypothetical protein
VASEGGAALTARASRDGESAVLRLVGEIDISNSERLRGGSTTCSPGAAATRSARWWSTSAAWTSST